MASWALKFKAFHAGAMLEQRNSVGMNKRARKDKSLPNLMELSSTCSVSSFDLSDVWTEMEKEEHRILDTFTFPSKKKTTVDGSDDLFWLSPSAKNIYVFILLALILQMPILLHGISVVAVRAIAAVCFSWGHFFSQDRQSRAALSLLRGFFRRIAKEGEKAVGGDYSRQVAAAYVIYLYTAPGESYAANVLRYRMSAVNNQVINELSEWRERRLGYA